MKFLLDANLPRSSSTLLRILLQLPDDATAKQANQTLESFARNKLLERVSGRLAIVELWRVRFRPA